ncbi:site-specific integrase [Magnetospirillum sp. SS-4]|uniref:tyrosine-type recombinase/integrase n=1 Tax=Magnetospirillum sp. SS-4 TaxID=2681465 RepID=UPI00138206E8|nr:site-specific integrase [Magnetospirillum sp. SS-4]CAA7626024.1 Integrase family protein [Magnetospirillum sp. SS-4]
MATIRKRNLPSGEVRWMVDFRDAAGKRRAKMFERKRDADAFLVAARAQVVSGTFVHDRDTVTMRKATEHWLEQCLVRRDAGQRMEASSYKNYEGKVRLHILDEAIGIGGIKLANLDTTALEAFRDRLLQNGRTVLMVRSIMSVIGYIMKAARKKKWCTHDPVADVETIAASRIKSRVHVPSDEDVVRMIVHADMPLKPMLMVSAFCGLRASELRGLTWDNVDLDAKLIKVVQRLDFRNVFGPPKTNAGVREVPMADEVVSALRVWKLRSQKHSLRSEHNFVFATRNGTPFFHSEILKSYFYPIRKLLGIETRWHDLRHYAISCWLRQGYSIKETQAFAGHASAQMTIDRYGHYLTKGDRHYGMNKIVQSVLKQHSGNTDG